MDHPSQHPKRTRGQRLPAALAVTAVLGSALAVLPGGAASASSHREAPLITDSPKLDGTDVYAFRSPDAPDTLTILANFLPFQEPAGGPNFYPFDDKARYSINIDTNGDAKADIEYEFRFQSRYQNRKTFLYNTGPVTSLDDPDLNYRQTFDLRRREKGNNATVLQNSPVAPSYVGAASMPDYWTLRSQAIAPFTGGTAFAGQADDPFFLDLRVFDLLYGGDLSEVGNDTLAGFNVNTLGIQVPIKDLVKGDDPVVGVWTSVRTPNAKGEQVQVSRLGNPLVNEVVIPVGDKDAFNASMPQDDGQFLDYVTEPEVPELLEAIYGIPAPATPRDDLVSVFLTGVPGLNQPKKVTPGEMLRVNTSTPVTAEPNRMGVLAGDLGGFPNGRRLGDDVLDIGLQALAGVLTPDHPAIVEQLGDGVDANDRGFTESFPYVALPGSGSVPSKAGEGVTLLTGGLGQSSGGGFPTGEVVQASGAALAALSLGGLLLVVLRRKRLGGLAA